MPTFRFVRPHVILLLICALAFSACGFKMRGVADLSFKTLYIQGPKLSIYKDLVKSMKINGVRPSRRTTSRDMPGIDCAVAQSDISLTACSMKPWATQSASNIGDLFGIRMYSISWGTISSSHFALTNRSVWRVSTRLLRV